MCDPEGIDVDYFNKYSGYRVYVHMEIMHNMETTGSQEERLEARKLRPRSTAVWTGANTEHQQLHIYAPEVILRAT